jgi:hypothetical protein
VLSDNNKHMKNEQAINVLIQVAHLAQKGGLLQLNDAVAVAQAINALAPAKEEVKDSAEEVK